jgi:hypothetical protein
MCSPERENLTIFFVFCDRSKGSQRRNLRPVVNWFLPYLIEFSLYQMVVLLRQRAMEVGEPQDPVPVGALSSTLLLVSERHLLYHLSHLLRIDIGKTCPSSC